MATTPTDGKDYLTGSAGNDFVRGMGGDDVLSGTHWDNMTSDGRGNYTHVIPILANMDPSEDVIWGETGNDTLYGGGGRDNMMGGLGDDLLVGGAGPDWLIGDDGSNLGPGRNPAAGAQGRDIFKLHIWTESALHLGGGPDVIVDFWPGVDKIDISWLEREHSPGFRWIGMGSPSGGATLEAGFLWNEDGNTVVNIYHAGTRAGLTSVPAGYDPYWGPKGPPSNVPTGSVVLLGKHTLTANDFVWHEGGGPVGSPAPRQFADEYQAQAVRMYDTVFGRKPDADGLTFWHSALSRGYSLDSIADLFMTSPEFQSVYAGTDTLGFVSRLYWNVLDRPGEQSGIDHWTGHLNSGALDRSDVVVFFSESEEHRQIVTAADYLP